MITTRTIYRTEQLIAIRDMIARKYKDGVAEQSIKIPAGYPFTVTGFNPYLNMVIVDCKALGLLCVDYFEFENARRTSGTNPFVQVEAVTVVTKDADEIKLNVSSIATCVSILSLITTIFSIVTCYLVSTHLH